MAITSVAATKIQSGTASASVALAATAGDALIVGGPTFKGTTWTVTRSGDSFTTDLFDVDGSSLLSIAVANACNVGAPSQTCQIASTLASGISGWALELSGLPTSSPLDGTPPATVHAATQTPTSNSETNTSLAAVYICVTGIGSGDTTISVGSGYSATVGGTTMIENQGSIFTAGGMEFQVVSTSALRTGAWSYSGATAFECNTGIVCYKAQATGLPPGLGPVVQLWEPTMDAALAAMMR